MGGRETNTDDGPKLREEGNYQDFYYTLTKDDQLPLFIKEHNNNVDDIYINADTQSLEFNHGIQVKQLICNGKINVEPLVIESMESGCHHCKVDIESLNTEAGSIQNNQMEAIQQHKKKPLSPSPFQETTYLNKLDTDSELSFHHDLSIIQNDQRHHFKQMMAQLCKITPNLKHLTHYYDMDAQDELFLQHLKDKYDNLTLDDLRFEAFFTILELEYTLFQSHIPKPPPPPAFPDQLCSICNGQEITNNTIVFCDCCNIAVHQDCYGIIFIPPGPWLCRVCLQNSMLSQRPKCIVCPELEGPMKQTTSGNWIHVTCAVWIRELNFGNWHYLEPVEGVERIPNLRWKLNCFICKQKVGACIQCSNKNCFTAYHVSCARRLGLTMTPLKTGSLAEMALGNDNELESFCDKHSHITGETNKYRTFDTKIEELRNEIERANEAHRGNLQNEIIIPPHIFADYISQSIIELGVLNDVTEARELSFDICKYWSLKREYNRGEPLFNISDNIFQYCYNLLEEDDIKNKISFIDVILKDLTKIEKLTNLVNDRYEKENELRETKEKIRKLLSNTNFSIIKEKFLTEFVNVDPFKVIKKYLIDNDLDNSFVEKCTEFKFENTFEFEATVDDFLKYLKGLNVISRIISSSIDKLESAYKNIVERVKEIDINKLLRQDFVIDENDPTYIVERSWHGKMLMEDEDLSDVEDLSIKELRFVRSLSEPISVNEMSSVSDEMRVGRRPRSHSIVKPQIKRSRGRPGPKPRGRPGKPIRSKPRRVLRSLPNPEPEVQSEPKPRSRPGRKPKVQIPEIAPVLVEKPVIFNKDGSIRKKPGPKLKVKKVFKTKIQTTTVIDLKPIKLNKDGSIRKKPGPKLKRKTALKPKIQDVPSIEPKPVILNKDGSVRKKPGPKTKKKYSRW